MPVDCLLPTAHDKDLIARVCDWNLFVREATAGNFPGKRSLAARLHFPGKFPIVASHTKRFQFLHYLLIVHRLLCFFIFLCAHNYLPY